MVSELYDEGKKEHIESAYQSTVAIDHVLKAAGDTPINAAMVRQLLKPVLQCLEMATD